jgi:hypothetical protein
VNELGVVSESAEVIRHLVGEHRRVEVGGLHRAAVQALALPDLVAADDGHLRFSLALDGAQRHAPEAQDLLPVGLMSGAASVDADVLLTFLHLPLKVAEDKIAGGLALGHSSSRASSSD